MTFRIPNADDAFNPNQAEPDAVDVDILVAGIAGDGVVSGCAVADQASGDLDVVVDAGTIAIGGDRVAVSGGVLSLSPAESNPRFDLIVAHDDGSISAVTGTGHAEPVFPGVPSGAVALAAVYVPAETSEITPDMIVDKRCIVPDPVFDHVDIDSGTLTASSPALTRAQTWNNALVDFVGSDTNITDTASGGGSLIERWRINGSVMASISKAGALVLAAGATLGAALALPAGAVGTPSLHLGDTTTGIYRPASNQIGIAASGVNVATFSSTGLTTTGINNTGNTTLGDASADTLTINAGTWTYGSNWTATRAAGALAAGTTQLQQINSTWSGDSGGTTTVNALRAITTGSGANAVVLARAFVPSVTWNGTATLTTANTVEATTSLTNTGNITAARTMAAGFSLSSSGSISGTADAFLAFSPGLSSTGTIATLNGLRIANQGNSLITTAVGVKIDNFTNSTNMRGIQSSLTSGANKWNHYIDGNAPSYHLGIVQLGSATFDSSNHLYLAGNAATNGVSGVTQRGILVGIRGGIDATTAINAVTIATIGGNAGSPYTTAAVRGFTVNNHTLGTNQTVAGQVGLEINDLTSGTNNYGVRISMVSGAAKWALLSQNDAQSAHVGNFRIGSTTAPTVALDVTGAALISSTLGVSGTLTLSGSAANIALGSNFISNGGTDAGLSFDGSNNATFSGSITSSALTSGRLPYVTTGGLLSDSSDLRWSVGNKYLIFSGNNAWGLGPNQGILFANGTTGATLSGNGTFDVTLRNRSGADVFAILGNTASVLLNASGSALATNATDGFTYLPTCAGTPTGTPTAVTGAAPAVIDETNHKLYFYTGGAWRDAGP